MIGNHLSWTAGLCLGLLSALGHAQEVESIKKQRDELVRLATDLNRQIDQIRRVKSASVHLAQLRGQAEQAVATYENRKATGQRIQRARQAVVDADRVERQMLEAQLAADPDAVAIHKRNESETMALEALESRQRIARFKLDELKRQAADDPEVAKAQAAYDKASEAYRTITRSDESVLAASREVEAARLALNARVAELPEKKALDEAQARYDAAIRATAPNREEARKAADAAAKRLSDVHQARAMANPASAPIIKELEEFAPAAKAAMDRIREGRNKLDEARARIAKVNPKVKEARQRSKDAQMAYREAVLAEAGVEHVAMERAQQTYYDRLEAEVAADPKVADARRQLAEVNKRIRELSLQLRTLEKAR